MQQCLTSRLRLVGWKIFLGWLNAAMRGRPSHAQQAMHCDVPVRCDLQNLAEWGRMGKTTIYDPSCLKKQRHIHFSIDQSASNISVIVVALASLALARSLSHPPRALDSRLSLVKMMHEAGKACPAKATLAASGTFPALYPWTIWFHRTLIGAHFLNRSLFVLRRVQ